MDLAQQQFQSKAGVVTTATGTAARAYGVPTIQGAAKSGATSDIAFSAGRSRTVSIR